ncbi:MAG: hypothetical protein ACRC4M_04365, partial [Mycoplasma sp.]
DLIYTGKSKVPYHSWIEYGFDKIENEKLVWTNKTFTEFLESVKNNNNGIFPDFSDWELKLNFSYRIGGESVIDKFNTSTFGYDIETKTNDLKKLYNRDLYPVWPVQISVDEDKNRLLNNENLVIFGQEKTFLGDSYNEHKWNVDWKNRINFGKVDEGSTSLTPFDASESEKIQSNLVGVKVNNGEISTDDWPLFLELKPSQLTNGMLKSSLKYFDKTYDPKTNPDPIITKNISYSDIKVSIKTINDFNGSLIFETEYNGWTGNPLGNENTFLDNIYNMDEGEKITFGGTEGYLILRQQNTIVVWYNSLQVIDNIKKLSNWINSANNDTTNEAMKVVKKNYDEDLNWILNYFLEKNVEDITHEDLVKMNNIIKEEEEKTKAIEKNKKQWIDQEISLENANYVNSWKKLRNLPSHLLMNCFIDTSNSIRFEIEEINFETIELTKEDN